MKSLKRKRLSFQEVEVLQDTTVKTRDVWTYSIVLFCFMVWPSLIRFAMALLSCRYEKPKEVDGGTCNNLQQLVTTCNNV